MDTEQLKQLATRTIRIEAEAVLALTDRIDAAFVQACTLLLQTSGRIIVMGMGKSGHVGRKIAATLASTGTPAYFVHPAEASHGDLGMITPHDVIMAISNSGETAELLALLPTLKLLGIPLITLTGQAESTLAREATINLDVSVAQEACPLQLAPTASTTATLVMGDALALALLEARGFTAEDFAFSHPGGQLGKQLLLRLHALMIPREHCPRTGPATPLKIALEILSQHKLGHLLIVDQNDKLLGLLSDGDVRRIFCMGHATLATPVGEVMTHPCRTITDSILVTEALHRMESAAITGLPVVDATERLIGFLHMHAILRASLGLTG